VEDVPDDLEEHDRRESQAYITLEALEVAVNLRNVFVLLYLTRFDNQDARLVIFRHRRIFMQRLTQVLFLHVGMMRDETCPGPYQKWRSLEDFV
jgi:uncharacterized protein (UPF0305 family)